jgi:hypothetical protein
MRARLGTRIQIVKFLDRSKTGGQRGRTLRYVPPMEDPDGYFGERVATQAMSP